MRSPGKRTVAETADLERIGSDATLLAAVLEVHRELDLDRLAGRLLDYGRAWSGATWGLALTRGEGRNWSVAASVQGDEEGRKGRKTGVDSRTLEAALATSPLVFEGLGPLAEHAQALGLPDAAGGLALTLPGPGDDACEGILVLLFAAGTERPAAERLQRLIELSRPALQNALVVQSMRELVIKDDTAECFNRRHFENSLPEELSRARRFRAPLSLIFLDMDNLKQVNNQHGHAMGSRTLYEVSRRVRSKIRGFDKLFRFGGDEFCIVLPETEWHGALEVAERVRDAIAGRAFLVTEIGEPGVRMTASLGIASFPLHARTQADLIEHADRAMQRIKSGTKNSIGIAEIVGERDES